MPEPRQVFLFSGHMIDAPGRKTPRFPPDKEPIAARAIATKLDEWNAGPPDLAMCGGACGGDLLFAEACLERGLRLEVRIPLAEPDFLRESVSFAGDSWVDRYYRVKSNARTAFRTAPEQLGPLPDGEDPFSRNNLWMLRSALAFGEEKMRFLCLWNRQGGDGPGGTKHMVEVVSAGSGTVEVLDTARLWHTGAA